MQLDPRPLIAAVLGAALALAGPPAAADGSANGDAPAGPAASEAPKVPISDGQLVRFAAAYNAISPLRRKYSRQMQEADSEAERARIREAADRDWARAIRDQGLEVEEFQTIGRELNARRGLQERMNELMRDR